MNRLVCISMFLLAMLPFGAAAQEDYRFEAGVGVGMTGYLGDANSSNLWRNPGVDGMGLFRYKFNQRLSLKTGLYGGTLSGNTEQMENVMPGLQNFKFNTSFFELSEALEFNFFPFGEGMTYQHLRRFTPYITAGVGVAVWHSSGDYWSAAPIIPLGVGLKYKLSERWNVGLEFLMKKVFSDRLDSQELSDPYLIKSSFAKNTDWYSTLSVTVSYEFSRRCATCHYKE